MTEGSGTIIHDICNGNDGSWTQGVNWASDILGFHLLFSASGNGPRITINAPALSNTTSTTVEIMIMPGSIGGRVIGQMGVPNSGSLRYLLDDGGCLLRIWGATGEGDVRFGNGTSCLPTNQWTHLAFQINGDQVVLFRNGGQVNSATLPYPQTLRATNASTEIGTGEGIYDYDGKIQYIRISNGIRNDFLLSRP